MLLIFLCVWGCPQRPDDCVRSPRTGVKGSSESPHRYWEMNLCPPQELQLLLISEAPLQLISVFEMPCLPLYILWAHSASLIMSNFTQWHPFYFLREILVSEAFKKSKLWENAFPPKLARCSSLIPKWGVLDNRGGKGFQSLWAPLIYLGTHSMKGSLSQSWEVYKEMHIWQNYFNPFTWISKKCKDLYLITSLFTMSLVLSYLLSLLSVFLNY